MVRKICFSLSLWIWIVSRQGPRTGASHRQGDDYGAAWLDSRLLNSDKEPADTTDWGKMFHRPMIDTRGNGLVLDRTARAVCWSRWSCMSRGWKWRRQSTGCRSTSSAAAAPATRTGGLSAGGACAGSTPTQRRCVSWSNWAFDVRPPYHFYTYLFWSIPF